MKRSVGEGGDFHPRSIAASSSIFKPERSIRLFRPANSTRMFTPLPSVNSPRTIGPKKAALKTIVSPQDGEDLFARGFNPVGHVFRLKIIFRQFLINCGDMISPFPPRCFRRYRHFGGERFAAGRERGHVGVRWWKEPLRRNFLAKTLCPECKVR